jgi:hypothetical protein
MSKILRLQARDVFLAGTDFIAKHGARASFQRGERKTGWAELSQKEVNPVTVAGKRVSLFGLFM